MKICIGNLHNGITGSDLSELFQPFGQVATAHVLTDRCTGICKGLGFVYMPSRNEAVLAVAGLNGRNLAGQVMTVHEVQTTDPVSGAAHLRCACRNANPTIRNTRDTACLCPQKPKDR